MTEEQAFPAKDERLTGAERLEHVVDDLAARRACEQWVSEELGAGRSPEELTEQLTVTGWARDEAELLVEALRKETRHERGVVTRDDVVRQANAKYQRGMSGWMIGFPVLGAAQRLLYGLANLITFRRPRGRNKP